LPVVLERLRDELSEMAVVAFAAADAAGGRAHDDLAAASPAGQCGHQEFPSMCCPTPRRLAKNFEWLRAEVLAAKVRRQS